MASVSESSTAVMATDVLHASRPRHTAAGVRLLERYGALGTPKGRTLLRG